MKDRRKFIQSVLEGYPVPSIFLYRREENGRPIYDVLDGKQRLETNFMFSRVWPFKRSGFAVGVQFPSDEEQWLYDWRTMEREGHAPGFLSYRFQVAEVSGEFGDIVELFVRINSTGKALTSSEKRHAHFYTSPLLRQAEKLTRRFRDYFIHQGIVSEKAITRMKDVELVTELVASIIAGGPIHKKQAVDKAVGNTAINAHTLNKAVGEFMATLRAVKQIFPDLRVTRFNNVSEFYTLFVIIWKMNQERLVLHDGRRNKVAMGLLKDFSDGVDKAKEDQRLGRGVKPNERMFLDYLFAVQQSTDALGQRNRRSEMIHDLFAGLFERKDERRLFSAEQRRLLWNTEEKKKCSICGVPLDWTNFHMDHKKAHSWGGKTDLRNAALTCVSCNTSKGAGRGRRT
jgi:hypothetical protein